VVCTPDDETGAGRIRRSGWDETSGPVPAGYSCWLLAAAGLVADGCSLLPLAAGCCYYRPVVIPSAALAQRSASDEGRDRDRPDRGPRFPVPRSRFPSSPVVRRPPPAARHPISAPP